MISNCIVLIFRLNVINVMIMVWVLNFIWFILIVNVWLWISLKINVIYIVDCEKIGLIVFNVEIKIDVVIKILIGFVGNEIYLSVVRVSVNECLSVKKVIILVIDIIYWCIGVIDC